MMAKKKTYKEDNPSFFSTWTKGEALTFYQTLSQLPDDWTNTQLLYAIHKNLAKLKPLVKPLLSTQENIFGFQTKNPEYKAYNQARIDLLVKLAGTDANGNTKTKVVVEEGRQIEAYDVDMADPKVIQELAALKKSHEGVFKTQEEQIKSYNDLLTEPFEENYDPHYLALENIPTNCPPRYFQQIFHLIKPESD